MNDTTRTMLRLSAATVAALGLVAGALWWGVYDVGADTPHTRPVYAALEFARERSIAVRAAQLTVPALDDPRRIRNGAGNYAAMCAGCHLAPGMAPTELARGLYPAPPNLSARSVEAATAFWTIKHGVKASGMPAWGASMGDEHVWDLAAFLQVLPNLDAAGYRDLVARSGGHSHGGGETAAPGHGHGPEPAMPAAGADGHEHGHDEASPEAAPHPSTPAAMPEHSGHEHPEGQAHSH